jgi:hypothetical protein
MSRDVKTIMAVLAGVLLLVFAALLLWGGSTETQVLPAVELPPPGAAGPNGLPAAVVMSMHKDQDTSIFGLPRSPAHFIVSVQFYAPASCLNQIADGDPWPVTIGGVCSTEVPIAGIVSGIGIAPTGETIVVVDAEVSQECFELTYPGDFWPSDQPECVAAE